MHEDGEQLPSRLNNLDALTSIQKILIVCKSISEIDTILKFVHNFRNNQIKELISNVQQKQKIATIEYYLVQKSGNPRWFFNGLDRLSQYLQEILAFPLLDPFWCHIADFEKSYSI